MMHIMLIACAVLAVSTTLNAQSEAETIEIALLAAPARAQAGATVVDWDENGNRIVRRQGSNGMVCYDRSGDPGQRPFSVQCTSEANLPRIEQNRKALAEAGDGAGAQKLLDALEANGTREAPEFGSVWHSLSGNDQESARLHLTVAVPFATSETLGVPSQRSVTGLWIMNAGTSTAHLMVPGR